MKRPLSLLALLSLSVPRLAQQDVDTRLQALERKNAELERRLEALAEEQEGLTLGGLVPPLAESRYGLGPSASKVYSASEGLSLGGYAEALYERRSGDTPDEIDFLRLVTYIGYRFDEHWVFNSEIEYEHGGEEVGVEFAYLDYLWKDSLNFRAGLVLIPMGFVNELHEPPTFLAAKRTEIERRILPSTWRENGAGVFGDAGGFSYRAYVVNGFDATGFSDQGLRGGRQNGSEALAEDLAIVGRLDWTETPGLLVGAALYFGDSGQEQAGLGATTVTAFDLHGEWRSGGLWTRALLAGAQIDDVAELNALNGFTGAESVGEELEGYYVEAGYDILGWLARGTSQSLSPYVRYEAFDTQADVPSGFASDPVNDTDILTAGLNWRPRSNLVFKGEYQDYEDAADGWNLLMGFSF